MIDAKSLKLIPIDDGNHLVQTGSKRSEKHGRDNDDYFYNEVTTGGEVVWKYQIWEHTSIYPPQRSNSGWKKMDLGGLVVSEGKL